jgi:hypothetical protein
MKFYTGRAAGDQFRGGKTLHQFIVLAAAALVTFGSAGRAQAQINPGDSLTNWTPVLYGPSVFPDPFSDQQTGNDESDIVGSLTRASFFTQFWNGGTTNILNDGTLGFRLRLAGEKNPAGFSTAAIVGIDVTSDGAIDLFVGVNNSGASDSINIWRPDPGSSNNSPATADLITTPLFTWSQSSTNYSWMVSSAANDPGQTIFDIDNNGSTDRFLTWVVPFASLISAFNTVGISNLNEVTSVRYMAITATQENSFNQDINGITNGISSSTTFQALGVLSQDLSINPLTAVPEPSTTAMLGSVAISAVGLLGLRQRARR